MCITYINFTAFEEYLRDLEDKQIDGQTEREKKMHKHFLTLYKNVNNVKKLHDSIKNNLLVISKNPQSFVRSCT